MTRHIGPKGLALIKSFEGCAKKLPDGRFTAYPDPGSGGDPWTIGWGSTGPGIHKGTIWTQAECDARLDADAQAFAAKVDRLLGDTPTTPGQFSAMTAFAYNVGIGNFGTSTLLKMHRAGNYAGAARQFGLWTRAAGRVLPGLVKRRAAEAALYELPA
jgi:lysozyme